MNKKLNVVVTGASGFIGMKLMKRLLFEGYKVFAISRDTRQAYQHPNLLWISWNRYVNDLPKEEEIFAVLNLATVYGHFNEAKSEIIEGNVTLPLGLFEYVISLRAKKIISADTFIGKPEYNYQHTRYYIESKNQLADLTKTLIYDKGVNFINLRLEHVFGANDRPYKFVSKLIRDFQLKKNIIELTDGTQKRDFIYVEDVVDAFMIVMNHDSNNNFKEYEVGTGKSIELKLFCYALAKAFDVSPDIFHFGNLDQRHNEIMNSVADIEALTSIGWTPTWNLNSAMSDLAKKQKLIDI